jgi:ABC-type branched-subunit amino acid transport system substrate-binding protein
MIRKPMPPWVRNALGAALAIVALLAGQCWVGAAEPSDDGRGVEVGVSVPMSGDERPYGQEVLEGIQLATEEANNAGGGVRMNLKLYDDKGDDATAREVAGAIAASPAALMLGPVFSKNSLAAGPVYAAAGVASLATTCTSDLITRNASTFRVIFKNSDQGVMLALYLSRVLGKKAADVISVDDGYGQTLEKGFRSVADSLGISAQYYSFKTAEEAEKAARAVAADPAKPPVLLLTLDADAARLLLMLRRNGAVGPFLGGDALGNEFFAKRLADEPEEKQSPGYFTEGLYAISPMILDSANAEILAFAARFRARFGHSPDWESVAGYDSARLAAGALATAGRSADPQARRSAVLASLNGLTDPSRALPGLLGPIWFDAERGRPQAIRIGQFHRGRFESAPLQIVPVSSPDAADRASGAVFEVAPGRFGRLQRIVYTGMFVNEIPRIDLSQSSFGADLYLWLRYARDGGPGAPDPTDVIFPNMVSGTFDRAHPDEQREMSDGSVYRLWRIRGTFRNEFDLHDYPFDRQRLKLSVFNARAAADRIIYALDQRSSGRPSADPATAAPATPMMAAVAGQPALKPEMASIAPAQAFRDLTQWEPLDAHASRDNLVTDSALGDPARTGAESYRELSGFQLTIDVARRAIATLTKTLLPLLLMTVIMFASLFFPHGLVKEKITVAITAALSGAVLLSAINSQLGGVGYTVAVEYAFYIFFGLSTLCIVSVLGAERLRVAGRQQVAMRTEQLTRLVFLAGVVVVVIGAGALWR